MKYFKRYCLHDILVCIRMRQIEHGTARLGNFYRTRSNLFLIRIVLVIIIVFEMDAQTHELHTNPYRGFSM